MIENLGDVVRNGAGGCSHLASHCRKDAGPAEKRVCDAVTLGFIIGDVGGSILRPPGEESLRYKPSLNTLLWELNNIVIVHIGMTGHELCPRKSPNKTVAATIRALLNEMSIYLPWETREYLQKQTGKVGAIGVRQS